MDLPVIIVVIVVLIAFFVAACLFAFFSICYVMKCAIKNNKNHNALWTEAGRRKE